MDSHLAAREELKVDGADVGHGCFHRGRRNGGSWGVMGQGGRWGWQGGVGSSSEPKERNNVNRESVVRTWTMGKRLWKGVRVRLIAWGKTGYGDPQPCRRGSGRGHVRSSLGGLR